MSQSRRWSRPCAASATVLLLLASLLVVPAAAASAAPAATVAPAATIAPATPAAAALMAPARRHPTVRVSVPIGTRYGKHAKVMVRVSGNAGGATGTVTATVGGRKVAAHALRGGSAALSVPANWVGRRMVLVRYTGNARYLPARKDVGLVVVRARSKPVAPAATGTYGRSATLRVTVRGNGVAPVGTVTVTNGTARVGRAIVRSGKATVRLNRLLAPGTRRLVVHYSGDARHGSSKVRSVVTIARRAPRLAVSAGSALTGTRAKITVRVNGIGTTPGGIVRLTGGGHVHATAKLVGGRATLKAPAVGVGAHQYNVRYAGSARYRPAAAPVRTEVTRARSFGNGTVRVGVDIPSGLYRARIPAGEMCYWARLRNTSGSLSAIIANDLRRGYGLIRVKPGDRFVESSRCGTWRLVSETASLPFRSGTIPGNGMFVVGRDVAPGTYRQSKSGCYAASLTDATGTFGSIIANDFTSGPSYWTIRRSASVFETSSCGSWHRVG